MAFFDTNYTASYLKWVAFLAIIYIVIFICKMGASPAKTIAIVNSNATVYEKPLDLHHIGEGNVVANLKKNDEVALLAHDRVCFYVQLPSGERGYLSKHLVGDRRAVMKRAGDSVYDKNPYEKSSSSNVVGATNKGDTVTVLEIGIYYKIRLPDNTTGYARIDDDCAFLSEKSIPAMTDNYCSKFTLKGFEKNIIGKPLGKIEAKYKKAQFIKNTAEGFTGRFLYQVYDAEQNTSYSFVNINFREGVAVDYDFEGAKPMKQWRFLKAFPISSIFLNSSFMDTFIGKTQFYPSWAYNGIFFFVSHTGFAKFLMIALICIVGLLLLAFVLFLAAFLPYLAALPFVLFFAYAPSMPNWLVKWLILLTCLFFYYMGLNVLVLINPTPWLFWPLVVIMLFGCFRAFTELPFFIGNILDSCSELINGRCSFCRRMHSYRLVESVKVDEFYSYQDSERIDYSHTSGNTRYYNRRRDRYHYKVDRYTDTYQCMYCSGSYKRTRDDRQYLNMEHL